MLDLHVALYIAGRHGEAIGRAGGSARVLELANIYYIENNVVVSADQTNKMQDTNAVNIPLKIAILQIQAELLTRK